MLAQSPPLPLVIDYFDADRDITAEEEGIILALEQRDRVRRIRLQIAVLNLPKFITSVDEEYPMLEYLVMGSSNNRGTTLMLPETLQAPHLRHLLLHEFVLPIRSQLLTTAVGLVTLRLYMGHPTTYFQPNTLLQWISFMPQLEALVVGFYFPVPNHYVERQITHAPIVTHVALPNLRSFEFRGVSAYLEAVVRRITTPRLESLTVRFFKQLTFSVPRLLQFMDTTEILRFDSVQFQFSRHEVQVVFYSHEGAITIPLAIHVDCWHLDWQVSSVVTFFSSHSQIPSMVEHLTLEHEVHSRSSEEHNEVDRTQWRKLLRSFINVKTLLIGDGLVKELSRSLRLEDGELALELLPRLQELIYTGSGDTGDAFTPFIDARQNAGRPVILLRPSPISATPPALSSSSPGFSVSSDLISGSGEAGSDPDT